MALKDAQEGDTVVLVTIDRSFGEQQNEIVGADGGVHESWSSWEHLEGKYFDSFILLLLEIRRSLARKLWYMSLMWPTCAGRTQRTPQVQSTAHDATEKERVCMLGTPIGWWMFTRCSHWLCLAEVFAHPHTGHIHDLCRYF